jgi:hypothetical protein
MITEPRVVAGNLISLSAVPTAGAQLVVTLLGGEVVIEGVPVRMINDNFSGIVDGEYLLFLKRDQDEGKFSIYRGESSRLRTNR